METFAEAVTQFCLRKHLIDSHQTEWCHYMVVHRAMSIISLLWLVPVGALLSKWYISLAFVLSYRFLRSRTGGYHAKTPFGCILSSTCLQIAGMCFVSSIVCNLRVTSFQEEETHAGLFGARCGIGGAPLVGLLLIQFLLLSQHTLKLLAFWK